ncbi:aldehyde dehydrogenase family protein [Iamia majanohamensis]|uniref:aldehyde dehydrogenase (NAD(+)) n=1 Tax=Iamia majanohamensis TaxID=467976 RepID=A0AAF0BW63_9ACTN|nr:aldehyde dehydrogenase family protein [Iamia majanohamensis]WCO67465.1 aldehyde dehydrogenase family protein [Iamia majanohamensis]
MRTQDSLYIDGRWVPSTGTGTIDVVNASTEEVMGTIPEGTAEDVDRAVAAARAAFDAWSTTEPSERAKVLRALSDGLAERGAEIAEVITGEVGMPLKMSQRIQAGLPTVVSGTYVDLIDQVEWEVEVGNSLVVKEPIGVVGAITPWNYPLHQIVAKVAPALAAGCTVVLKPSEVAPLNAFVLAEIIDGIGLPAGVFNLVTGVGPVVGEAIAAHPDVDMVSFTGSTRAGTRVAEVASSTVKRVALELGGKSANVILDDLEGDELDTAVRKGVGSCYLNSGQTCTAFTRMLVPRSKHDEIVDIIRDEVESTWTLGDPATGDGRLGPLISDTQRERVRGYIRQGIDEGATLVTGGDDAPDDLPTGYYVKPTVFAGVDNAMTIAQEEIFGPVLSVIPYDDTDDAVRIANDTTYGLAGGVWGGDAERARAVARRLRTGQVEVNGGGFNPLAPFGGYKMSGNGRELGMYGLEEFLQTKALQL